MGGFNVIMPVVRAYGDMGPPCSIKVFATGAAARECERLGIPYIRPTLDNVMFVDGEMPKVVVTSMCSEVGRAVVDAVSGLHYEVKPKTIAVSDYWGGRLTTSWADTRPDYICVNDQLGEDLVLRAWPDTMLGGNATVVITGYPWFDKYLDIQRDEERARFRKAYDIDVHDKVILFAGDIELGGEELERFTLGLRLVCPDVCLIARHHPNLQHDDPAQYAIWNDAVAEFERASGRKVLGRTEDFPPLSVLCACDMVVSRYSTMSVEAALVGVRHNLTLMFPEGRDMFQKSVGGLMKLPPIATLGLSLVAMDPVDFILILHNTFEHWDTPLDTGPRSSKQVVWVRGEFPFAGDNSRRVAETIKFFMER